MPNMCIVGRCYRTSKDKTASFHLFPKEEKQYFFYSQRRKSSVFFKVQILGMRLALYIISSTSCADDEDDEKVVWCHVLRGVSLLTIWNPVMKAVCCLMCYKEFTPPWTLPSSYMIPFHIFTCSTFPCTQLLSIPTK